MYLLSKVRDLRPFLTRINLSSSDSIDIVWPEVFQAPVGVASGSGFFSGETKKGGYTVSFVLKPGDSV